jgi:Transposase
LKVEFSRNDNEEILMMKSRFTEAQIMGVLRQVEGGVGLAEVCREHAISSATFCKWRSKYGAIRSDNGVPFASPNALFNFSKLAVWWLRLGISI